MGKINYKYDEGNILSELKEYIDSTYDEHYSKNKFQATEFIIDGGHGEGFCIGNIMKYAQRYGKKGGKNRRDLLKVIHYGIIALYINEMEDDEYAEENNGRTRLFIDLKGIADFIENEVQRDNPDCDIEICGVDRWE